MIFDACFETYVGLKFVYVWFSVDLGLLDAYYVDLRWFRVSLGLACGLPGVYSGLVKGLFRFRSNIIQSCLKFVGVYVGLV